MRALFAILADFALAHPDGKFYIVGGGVERVQAATIPSEPRNLSLAVRLELEAAECGHPHALRVLATAPDGKPFLTTPDVIVSPPGSPEQQPVRLGFVLNFSNLIFSQDGHHSIALASNDNEILRLGFLVSTVLPTGTATLPQSELYELQRAFLLFEQGQIPEAERIIRAFVSKYPSSGLGHNNLGFVLLARTEAKAAIAEFDLARSHGFERPDLLRANLACAEYLVHNEERAFALFKDCLEQQAFLSSAFLLALRGSEAPFPQLLLSAGEYTTLIALNAAWSALPFQRDSAHSMYALARSGHAAHPLRGAAFQESLESLGSQLSD